jgi:hypothetical protein
MSLTNTESTNTEYERGGDKWKMKTKSPTYHKEYYQNNKDVVGNYTVLKYVKNKYGVSNEDYHFFGDEFIKEYGKYILLQKALKAQFPEHPMFSNI